MIVKHDKYQLRTQDGSRLLGEHDTRAEAEAQERAVEAHKHDHPVHLADEPGGYDEVPGDDLGPDAPVELAHLADGTLPAAEARRRKARGTVVDIESSPLLMRALGMQSTVRTPGGQHVFVDATPGARHVSLAASPDTADGTDAPPLTDEAVAKLQAVDADPDRDDDGEVSAEHFPLPAGLLDAAELDAGDPDADYDALPAPPPGGAR